MFIGENLENRTTDKKANIISIFTTHKYPQIKYMSDVVCK